jgi:hypothetical protein
MMILWCKETCRLKESKPPKEECTQFRILQRLQLDHMGFNGCHRMLGLVEVLVFGFQYY